MVRKTFIITALFLLVSVPARAGWVTMEKSGDKTFFSGGKLKAMSGHANNKSVMIFDMNKGTMMMSDSKRKVYATGAPSEYCDAMSAMMEQMMSGMTPEQRAMMKNMKKQSSAVKPPKVTVVDMGKSGAVAGLATTKYKVMVDGALYKEIWLNTTSPFTREMRDNQAKFERMSKKYSACMNAGMGMQPPDPEDSPEYARLEKSGMVLKDMKNGKVQTEFVKIEKRDIQDSEFAPPTGYRKISVSKFFKFDLQRLP